MDNERNLVITLTKFGYKCKKNQLNDKELKDLRVMVQATAIAGYGAKPKPFGIYNETQNTISVPYYFGKEYFKNYTNISYLKIKDKSASTNLEFNGTLREPQQKLIDSVMKHFETDPRCMLECPTGFGKTLCMLNLISRLKKRTLIIVHKQFLADQWVERIREFLPTATVGVICQDKFEPDNDIIIGMLQSLSMREYPEIKDLGVVCVDEMHHIGSTVFSKALLKYSAPNMIGLSATIDRKDGLTNVLDWTFGKRFAPENNNQFQQIHVKIVKTQTIIIEKVMKWTGVLNTQNAINQLTEDPIRTRLIIKEIRQMVKDDTKCILLVSDRIAHLKQINQKLLDYGIDSSLYIGGMTTESRELATKSRVLCGTYSMVQEAFDCPKLNVLIFATPKRDIIQVSGRILRKVHEKAPIIIDIFDPVSVFQRWGFERFKFYKKRGYKMGNEVDIIQMPKEEELLEYAFDE